MNDWIRANGVTLTGWIATMLAVVFGFGMSTAEVQGSLAHVRADVMETRKDSAKNREDITEIKTDVEVMKSTARRSGELMDRQEEAIRRLEAVAVEVRTIVKAR